MSMKRPHRKSSVALTLANHVLGNKDVAVYVEGGHTHALGLLLNVKQLQLVVDDLDIVAEEELEGALIEQDGEVTALPEATVTAIRGRLVRHAERLLRRQGLAKLTATI